MMHVIKADFKRIFYLRGYRRYLLATCLLSIIFGIIFLFTIDLTAGKKLTELSTIDILAVTLLGIDAAAIMLIIFTAHFIAKEFVRGSIHSTLAITPSRKKLFFYKVLFIAVLSLLITILILGTFLFINQMILSANDLGKLSLLDRIVLLKLIGAIIMPVFYSLLSLASAFYSQSASVGITFTISIMFIPGFINMFSSDFMNYIVPIFPDHSLHVFTGITTTIPATDSIIMAVIILLIWTVLSIGLGLWKFRKADF